MERVAVAIDRGDVGVRIDRVLRRHLSGLPGVTRNRLQRLIDGGFVTVNGDTISRAAARVRQDDVICVSLPARKPRTPVAAEDLPLDVRYEDDLLLVVNKPAGQVAHPALGNPSGTLLNALAGYARGRWSPALVSRLDKGTSGVVLVAKNKATHAALQRLSNDDAIAKEYLAVVSGKPPARGTIDLALDRDPWDRRRVTVRDRGGVPSVTRFQRLKWVALAPDRFLSLLRCRLVTGRMHQIRVHLAAKGWPILGDAAYGVTFAGIDRQALHASRLTFVHPDRGSEVDVSAPPPADIAGLLRLFDAREIAEDGAECRVIERFLPVGDERR